MGEQTPTPSAQTVLIVGAVSGIGLKVLEQLLARGHSLIAADHDRTALAELAAAHPAVTTLEMDITDSAAVKTALATLNQNAPQLDAAVISAAAHATYPLEYVTDEHLEHIININLTAHIKLLRDLLPHLKNGGKMVGLSSNSADIGIPMESVYAATKAGLERIYEAMALELSYRNLHPVIIHPDNVNTGFNETGNDYPPSGNDYIDSNYQRIVASMRSEFGMPPEDVAKVVVKAIESAKPKVRYIVGMNAIKAHWAKRLLGTDGALKVMAKYFKMG